MPIDVIFHDGETYSVAGCTGGLDAEVGWASHWEIEDDGFGVFSDKDTIDGFSVVVHINLNNRIGDANVAEAVKVHKA